jgi:hypothetical protein
MRYGGIATSRQNHQHDASDEDGIERHAALENNALPGVSLPDGMAEIPPQEWN